MIGKTIGYLIGVVMWLVLAVLVEHIVVDGIAILAVTTMTVFFIGGIVRSGRTRRSNHGPW